MGSTQEVASRTKNIMRMNLHLEPISKSNGLKGFITCVATGRWVLGCLWLLVVSISRLCDSGRIIYVRMDGGNLNLGVIIELT